MVFWVGRVSANGQKGLSVKFATVICLSPYQFMCVGGVCLREREREREKARDIYIVYIYVFPYFYRFVFL